MNIPETFTWLDVALEEEARGVTEIPGAEANPRIVEYHAHTLLKATSDEVPWCAAFVGFCLDRAGVKSTASAAARSYCNWGVPAVQKRGAIVVFSRGDNAVSGHVGFLLEAITGGGLVVLGGNQADKVCRRTFPRSMVVACRWPKT